MPNFLQSLTEQDLGHLHIIAELWGVNLLAPDLRTGRRNLSELIIDQELVLEILDSLPPDARNALEAIRSKNGRLPWQQFIHRYGEIREMGPGKRDREAPHRNPSSISEILWYRGIIARAFLDSPDGLLEFAFIPDDLAKLIPEDDRPNSILFGRPATKKERQFIQPANDSIVDHACTLLAALRIGFSKKQITEISKNWSISVPSLTILLAEAGLLDNNQKPISEAIKDFLQLNRGDSLLKLYNLWNKSPRINDLFECPQLKIEGELLNRPLQTRENILGYLEKLDHNIWWSIPAFIAAIKSHHPDFQRKSGEYDSWFIKDPMTGDYLRGRDQWDKVEGQLIKYFITGPLNWLGILDLASASKDGSPIAFKFSAHSPFLLDGKASPTQPQEDQKIIVDSKLYLHIPKHFPRTLRYQISRFCEWDGMKKDNYRYQITSNSIERAYEQGLQAEQLLSLLKKNTNSKLPPNLVHALERWQHFGTQAKIEKALILKVKQPAILENLRKTKAKRFLGESLGPTTVIVKPGAWERVIEALGELGYLVDDFVD